MCRLQRGPCRHWARVRQESVAHHLRNKICGHLKKLVGEGPPSLKEDRRTSCQFLTRLLPVPHLFRAGGRRLEITGQNCSCRTIPHHGGTRANTRSMLRQERQYTPRGAAAGTIRKGGT